MSRFRVIIKFFLIIWFSFTFMPWISLYTVGPGVKFLQIIKGLPFLNHAHCFLVPSAVGIDLYVTMFLSGFLAWIILSGRLSLMATALPIFICNAIPIVVSLCTNPGRGGGFCLLTGQFISLAIAFGFVLAGASAARRVNAGTKDREHDD